MKYGEVNIANNDHAICKVCRVLNTMKGKASQFSKLMKVINTSTLYVSKLDTYWHMTIQCYYPCLFELISPKIKVEIIGLIKKYKP